MLEVHGWGELQPELNALSKTGDGGTMTTLIDETMLADVGRHGTPEECAAEIRRRFGDVAGRACAYFPGYDAPPADIADLVSALG